MADDVHQVIGAALALLAVEDPAAADDAQRHWSGSPGSRGRNW